MSDQYCPNCGMEGHIETALVEDELYFGRVSGIVVLEYTAPLRTCQACGYMFTDCEAEKIKDDRVNAYLYAIGEGRAKEWSPKWRNQKRSPA